MIPAAAFRSPVEAPTAPAVCASVTVKVSELAPAGAVVQVTQVEPVYFNKVAPAGRDAGKVSVTVVAPPGEQPVARKPIWPYGKLYPAGDGAEPLFVVEKTQELPAICKLTVPPVVLCVAMVRVNKAVADWAVAAGKLQVDELPALAQAPPHWTKSCPAFGVAVSVMAGSPGMEPSAQVPPLGVQLEIPAGEESTLPEPVTDTLVVKDTNSTAPMSHRGPWGRAMPRWSVVVDAEQLAASLRAEAEVGRCVGCIPPLLARAPSSTLPVPWLLKLPWLVVINTLLPK